MTDTALRTDTIDPGLDARRHSTEVFRYRVREHEWLPMGLTVRGKEYRPGDVILLSGSAAFHEAPYRLELIHPDAVEQTADPATWEAQSATHLHITLNRDLVINHEGCRVYASYAGSAGTARVEITSCCGEWYSQTGLTLEDAERIHTEIGAAIEEMKDRMFRYPGFENGSDDGDLHIHQYGGNM
jgi:hypothetical protein